MKAIKINKKRRNKLLEMCRSLFPEHLWGFGDFPTTEVGADYVGLDYLDVTHINHKVPCIKKGYKLMPQKLGEDIFKDFEDGYCNNLYNEQSGFTKIKKEIIQHSGNYEEVYIEGIHWFEFCTLFLMEKLLRDGGQKEFIEYMKVCFNYTFPDWDLVQDKIHPIDYLYEKFEKLK